jgi:hypothetical protein
MTISVYDGRRLLRSQQPVSSIGPDGWVSFRAPVRTVAGHNYLINVRAGDVHGNYVNREIVIRVPIPDTKVTAAKAKKAAAPKKPAPKKPATKKK